MVIILVKRVNKNNRGMRTHFVSDGHVFPLLDQHVFNSFLREEEKFLYKRKTEHSFHCVYPG